MPTARQICSEILSSLPVNGTYSDVWGKVESVLKERLKAEGGNAALKEALSSRSHFQSAYDEWRWGSDEYKRMVGVVSSEIGKGAGSVKAAFDSSPHLGPILYKQMSPRMLSKMASSVSPSFPHTLSMPQRKRATDLKKELDRGIAEEVASGLRSMGFLSSVDPSTISKMEDVASSLPSMLKQAGLSSRKVSPKQREILGNAILAFKDNFKATHSEVVQPRTGNLDPEKLYDSVPDGSTRLSDKRRYAKEMTKVMERTNHLSGSGIKMVLDSHIYKEAVKPSYLSASKFDDFRNPTYSSEFVSGIDTLGCRYLSKLSDIIRDLMVSNKKSCSSVVPLKVVFSAVLTLVGDTVLKFTPREVYYSSQIPKGATRSPPVSLLSQKAGAVSALLKAEKVRAEVRARVRKEIVGKTLSNGNRVKLAKMKAANTPEFKRVMDAFHRVRGYVYGASFGHEFGYDDTLMLKVMKRVGTVVKASKVMKLAWEDRQGMGSKGEKDKMWNCTTAAVHNLLLMNNMVPMERVKEKGLVEYTVSDFAKITQAEGTGKERSSLGSNSRTGLQMQKTVSSNYMKEQECIHLGDEAASAVQASLEAIIGEIGYRANLHHHATMRKSRRLDMEDLRGALHYPVADKGLHDLLITTQCSFAYDSAKRFKFLGGKEYDQNYPIPTPTLPRTKGKQGKLRKPKKVE